MLNKLIKGIMTLLVVGTVGVGEVAEAKEMTAENITEEQVLQIVDEQAVKDEVVKPAKVKKVKKAIKKMEKDDNGFNLMFGKTKINKDAKAVDVEMTLGKIQKKHFVQNLGVIAFHSPKGWTINVTGKDTNGKFNAAQVQNLDGEKILVHDHVDNETFLVTVK